MLLYSDTFTVGYKKVQTEKNDMALLYFFLVLLGICPS